MVQIVPRTRPSGQPLAAPAPRLDPNAFGAGVATALGNMANSVDQFAESELEVQDAQDALAKAEREKREKTDRFKSLRGLNELGVNLQQHLTELTTRVGPDADGYTNLAREELEKRRREWLTQVPEHLREEMEYRSGLLIDDLTTGAYKHEFSTGADYVRHQIGISQNQALTEIYDDPDSLDERTVQVLEEIAAAPYLTALEKEALAFQFRGAAEAAAAGAEIEIYANSQGTIGEADGSDIVAAGLPVVARGMLNAIASVEASGYDVMNGGQKFQGFDDHPGRVAAGGTSTAAGRYQFVRGTWQRVAAAIGAPNFAPEWQDRGAWWLAEQDFKARTGKDLYTELMSGDRARIIAVKKALQGRGDSDVTWKGLQNMGDDKWANYILGSHGVRGGMPEGEVEYPTGPALFDDPRYAHIPFNQRLALAEDAERRAAASRAEAEKEETARYQSWLTDYEFRVDSGEKGRADIESDLEKGLFRDLAHVERLRNIYDNRNAGIADAEYVATILANPSGVISRDDTRAQKGMNEIVKMDNGLGRLQEQDKDYVTQAIVPLAQRAQDIPTDVVGTLEAMARSNNPNQIAFAYETMRQLEAAAPDAFSFRMKDDAEMDYRLYMGLRDAHPADEVIPKLRRTREFRQEHKELAQEADEFLKDIDMESVADALSSFSPTADPELPPIPLNRTAFKREFDALFREAYAVNGDKEVATQVAIDMMKKSWAPTDFGGRWFMMKNPPERSGYPTVDQSLGWMKTQIEEEYPELVESSWYQLVADNQTRNETQALSDGKRDRLPSYLLYRADENGVIGAVLGEDNQPVRWRGDPAPFRQAFIERAAEENTQTLYFELEEKKAMQGGVLTPEEEAQRARLAEEVREIEARRAPPPRNARRTGPGPASLRSVTDAE